MHSKLALLSAPLALVLALAHHHRARAQYQDYGIPRCATACMEQAAIWGRCRFTDIGCICTALSDPPVMDTAVKCERGSCPQTDPGAPTAFEQFFADHCQG